MEQGRENIPSSMRSKVGLRDGKQEGATPSKWYRSIGLDAHAVLFQLGEQGFVVDL